MGRGGVRVRVSVRVRVGRGVVSAPHTERTSGRDEFALPPFLYPPYTLLTHTQTTKTRTPPPIPPASLPTADPAIPPHRFCEPHGTDPIEFRRTRRLALGPTTTTDAVDIMMMIW